MLLVFRIQSTFIMNPMSSRILTARFVSRFAKLSITQCYASAYEAEEETNEFQTVVDKVPKHDLLIVIGDISAKVGCHNQERKRASYMGRFGTGEMNENGELFARLLWPEQPINRHRNIHKNTWVSADRRTTNQIDHVTINKSWRSILLDSRVYRGADVGSDHYLVVANIQLRLRKASKPSTRRKRAADYLKNETTQNNFLNLQNSQNRYQTLQIP